MSEYRIKSSAEMAKFLNHALQKQNLDRFATELGVHWSTLIRWLNGKTVPNFTQIEAIAKALNYKLSLVKKGEGNEYNIDSLSKVINLLDKERKKQGLSLRDLAQLSGVSYYCFAVWQNKSLTKSPRFLNLQAIVHSLGYELILKK